MCPRVRRANRLRSKPYEHGGHPAEWDTSCANEYPMHRWENLCVALLYRGARKPMGRSPSGAKLVMQPTCRDDDAALGRPVSFQPERVQRNTAERCGIL